MFKGIILAVLRRVARAGMRTKAISSLGGLPLRNYGGPIKAIETKRNNHIQEIVRK
jgi:hypothetical protein